MEDINALYKALEQADAAGDKESAQQLADYIRSLPTEEPTVEEKPVDVTQPQKDITKPPVTKPAVKAAPIDVMGTQFTPEEYAKYSGMPIAAKPGEQAKGNFSGAFGRSIYNLAADLALEHGKITGNYKEAEETAKRLREYGDKTYTSTTKGWKEDPLAKIEELAGGSAPYMVAPIVAAMGGTALGATGAAAVAAPLLTSAYQFVGSNLQRQMEDNKKLEDTSLLKAGLTAIPQAALDQIGFRFIPGVQKLFGKAGIELTEEAAKKLIDRSILSKAGEKALQLGEAMTVEGATETAQQLLERLQAGLSIKSPEALQEYFDSFVGGVVLAGSLGGTHQVIEGVANKIGQQKQAEAEKNIEEEPETTEETRPSRETLKRQTFKELQAKAEEVNKAKKANVNLPTITQAGATADQGKLFNVVGPSVEVGKPIIVGPLDDATLTSWGIRKGSNAFKALQGVDVSTPEGRDLMDKTLEAHKGKLNEDAINAYTNILDQQKEEAPNAGIDFGTTTVSDAVSGGQKYGSPGAIEGRFGPTINISGGPTGIVETGKTDVNAPLEETTKPETLKTGERLLSIQELLNDPNPQQRRSARLRFMDMVRGENTEEVIKEGARLEREERAKFANLKKTQYPIVDQSTNLANILNTLQDKPTYLIEDLKNPDVPDAERRELNQHARDYLLAESLRNKYKQKMTVEERAALEKEGEAVAKAEKPLPTEELSEEDFKAMQDEYLSQQAQEPLEARARVENVPEGLDPDLADRMVRLERANKADAVNRTPNTMRSQAMLSRSLNKLVRQLYPNQEEWKVLGDLNTKYGDWIESQVDKTQEARAGEVLETGETPDSIEGAFQKQYGKNVRLAKQRGLLNFLRDVSELPPEIGKVSPTTKAVYYQGKGYFITNRITKEDAPRMLLHEIGVHYGLEGMLGTNNYKRIVKQIKQNHLTDKELKAAWDNTLKTYPEYPEGSNNFMQEVIANIGETAPNNTIWRQIVGYIKQFLSKLGYGWDINKITADDIRDMVQHSVRVALRGETTEAKGDLSMAAEEPGALKPTYYSQLTRVITNAQFKNNVSTQSGEQWVNWLNSKTSEAGVKRDELEFSGLLEFLELNPTEKFNKQDILNYLEDNGTKVTEYKYGEGEGNSYSDKDRETWVEEGVSEWIDSQPDQWEKANDEAINTYEFPHYVKEENVTDAEGNKAWRVYDENWKNTPADDTYYFSENEAQDVADDFNREGLDQLADDIHERLMRDIYETADVVRDELYDQWDADHEDQRTRYLDWTLEGGDKKYTEIVIALQNPKQGMAFSHQHWPDVYNPIAHYRVNARTDTKGNIVLFVEEIQSDWAQAPKKLRKKHIKELAQKYGVTEKQMASFVPGDWGFKRKFTPEQEKEYVKIVDDYNSAYAQRSKLSSQISKLLVFRDTLHQIIDFEVKKRIGPRDRDEFEYDFTRGTYIRAVLNQDYKERTESGYKIDLNVIKEISNIPEVKLNLEQYQKNQLELDKLSHHEENLYKKLQDLQAKKDALSQSGKIDRGPFVQDTEAWSNLVLKNIIRYAAERGYDKVAFVNGKQAAFKGGKADRIDEVFGTKNDDGTYNIYATLKDGGGRSNTLEKIRDLDLEDYVGGLADKFRALKVGETDGWDAGELKLPAQGMVEFYDHYIPRYASKLIKKLGGNQLEKIELIAPNPNSPEDEKVGIQTGFTLTSAMKDKAMAGLPLFARASKQQLDNDLKKSGTVSKEKEPEPTTFERFKAAPLQTVDEIVADFRKNFFSFDAAINNKIITAMRQQGVPQKEIAKSFYEIQVGQALHADQLTDMWMVHGGIKYDPASYSFMIEDFKNSMSTIREDLKALAKKYNVSEYEMYQYGNAAFVANRSQDLINQNKALKKRVLKLLINGKEAAAKKAMENYKLVHLTPAEIKHGMNFFKTIPELNKVYKTWNINRRRLLNFAVKYGLYTREKAEELLDVIDYVPFYREAQVEAKKVPQPFTRGLLDTAVDKRLKGSYQPVQNVFDNMERWARYTLKKAINNKAAQEKIKFYKKYIPDDIQIVKGTPKTKNTVGVWYNGKVVKYEFQGYDGKSMVDGFTGLEPVVNLSVPKFLNKYATFQRAQIVLEPLFNFAQITMDAFETLLTGGVELPVLLPLQVVKEILLSPVGLSKARTYLKKTGDVGKRDWNSEYSNIDLEAMKQLKNMKSSDKMIQAILSPAKATVKGLKFIGMAADNVIRQAVWSQVMLETGDVARATYVAREIINFRRTGSNAYISASRQMAPFVNANLQAANVSFGTMLLSGITPDTKLTQFRRLITSGAQVAAVIVALTAMNEDDDDYKKLDPKDRDRLLIIPGSGGYALPVRGSIITAIYKNIPEHLYNRYIAESEDSEKLRKGLAEAFKRAIVLPTGFPTFFTPALEMALNIDTVTGLPLRGQSQKDLEADLQYSNKYTSQLARWANDATGVSPILVQNFMNRWFASTSMLISMFTNKLIADMRGEILPEKTFKEWFLQLPNANKFITKQQNTRNINDYYELNDIVNAVVDSANRYKDIDYDKFVEYQAKDNNAAIIDMRKELATISRDLENLRKWENKIYASKDKGLWTPQTKKQELDRIEQSRQDILGHEQAVKDKLQRRIQNLRQQGGL